MTEQQIFQVSEFNEFINLYLEGVGEVIVEGEISQINVSKRIFLFATIKDEEAAVEVFGITHQISGYDILEEGMLVHVYGSPNLYQKSGRFSIKATRIVPAGEGALKLAFEKLKQKLEIEGLFDVERKRSLPKYPQKIGLITGKDSRAYGDFIKVLKNRMGGIEVYFVPALVQGKDSVNSVVAAINTLNKIQPDLDFIVLTRGGGSLEDLQSFNDEKVARAVYASKIPIVSAIGHEDDVSISDLVADVRASTPSNAAELVIPDRKRLIQDLNYKVNKMERTIDQSIKSSENKILNNIEILNNSLTTRIQSFKEMIHKFSTAFIEFQNNIRTMKERSNLYQRFILKDITFLVREHTKKVESIYRLLSSLSYENVLKRGYSITYDDTGYLLKSVKNIKKGQKIITKLYDGKAISEVSDIEK